MRWSKRLLVSLALAVMVVSLTCKKVRELPEGTVPSNATVILPSGCPVTAGNLTIYSGVYDEATVGRDGKARVGLAPSAVSTVVAATSSDQPVLYGIIVDPADEYSLRLDARSTAEALVFLHPYVVQSDTAFANDVVGLMQNSSEVADLVAAIETRLSLSANYLLEEDSAFTTRLLAAIKAIHSQIDSIEEVRSSQAMPAPISSSLTVRPSSSPPQKVYSEGTGSPLRLSGLVIDPDYLSGVHVRADDLGCGSYRIWVKNTWLRDVNAVLMQGGGYTGLDSTYLPSCGFISVIPPSVGNPESSSVVLDAGLNRFTWVRAYGPGCSHIDEWISDPAWARNVDPIFGTFMFNFALPAVSAFSGLPGIFPRGSDGASEIGRAVKDVTTIAKVTGKLQQKKVPDALLDVGKRLLGVIQEDPDILVNEAARLGFTITKSRVQELFKFVPYMTFLFSCLEAAKVGWTIGTVARSFAVSDFMIQYDPGSNQPPATPDAPDGPTVGQVGTTYDFTASTTDPEQDQIQYQFDWDNGTQSDWSSLVPSGQQVQMSYAWPAAGTYNVKVLAKDEHGSTSAWSTEHQIVISGGGGNNPPTTPSAPFGPDIGQVESLYMFCASATDPDGDSVQYQFDWGNGTQSDWSSLVPSRQLMRMSYAWPTMGTYDVKARARDEHGSPSAWSERHQIVITAANNPPGAPPSPSGPDSGRVGQTYAFSSSAVDPESDQVALRFDWGDGDTADWSTFVPSGQTVNAWHAWSVVGRFNVRAQAKDAHGAVSEWSSSFEVSSCGNAEGASVQPTADGGFVIAGRAQHPEAADYDVYVIKTDGSGHPEWTWTHGGPGDDAANAVIQTADGYYVIVGSIKRQSGGDDDVLLAKISGSGQTVWTQTYGGADGGNWATAVTQTPDGGYVITGGWYSASSQSNDILLLKTDAAGVEQWCKTFGGGCDDVGKAVVRLDDGSFTIAAEYDYCTQLLKTSPNGDSMWLRSIGVSGVDSPSAMLEATDGNLMIVGGTYWSGSQGYVSKADSQGQVEWTRLKFLNPYYEGGHHSIAQIDDGGFAVLSESTGGGTIGGVRLFRIDTAGNEQWSRVIGGPSGERGSSIARTSEGGLVFCGLTETTVLGDREVYLVKTDAQGVAAWERRIPGPRP